MNDIVWREPAWLLLALWPWLWFIARRLMTLRNRDYAEPALQPWAWARRGNLYSGWRYWREACLVLAWLFLAGAMAGPRLPGSLYSTGEDHQPELVVVLDISHSMSAIDTTPTRLERARLELYDMLRFLQGWRVGLVVYAARPHLLLPPTDDKSLFRYYLQIPRTGLLAVEGSDPLAALKFAAAVETSNAATRTLLLVTDGEAGVNNSTYEQDLRDEAVRLRHNGTNLYVLGIGSESGATLTDPDGGWLSQDGQPVITRLHSERLQQLSNLGGGRYIAATNDSSDWQYLYTNGIARQSTANRYRETINDNVLVVWRELYAWLLIPGALLLLLAHARIPEQVVKATLSPVLALLMLVTLGAIPRGAEAYNSQELQSAWQAFQQGAYQQAEVFYRQVTGYQGRMGEGSSAYQREEYRTAMQQFTRAVLAAENDKQRADALFNLANSYVQLQRYQEAIAIYEDVLVYRPKDTAATNNLVLARQLVQEQQDTTGSERGRQGPGSRSRMLDDGETPVAGSLTLGDTTQGGEGFAIEGDGMQSDQALPADEEVSLIDEGIANNEDRDWTYTIQSTEQLQLRSFALDSDPAELWQRLFEVEAGYPAPLHQPDRQPGVAPW